ncbi:hypothetical protein NEMIN01_0350 [Nematocida minor]|uniref:uncharacterized protein n=1 Tax=Nematocida minor TaxID=1912983 RepID=UPI0022204631|nr:uncharacterized protein NEMIN01_0350 [Nematocida minor]KAI5189184.1 hypothetical protein NEMIN01_0350 [Nematocida minor]
MILKGTLKQVILGILVLAYLQRASCLKEKDVKKIWSYWNERMTSMQKEFKIRRNFLNNKVKLFVCKEIPPQSLSEDIETGKTNLFNMEAQLSEFTENAETVLKKAKELIDLNEASGHRMAVALFRSHFQKIDEAEDSLQKMIPSALDKIDSLCAKIKEFDSHMLGVIEKCSKMKKKYSRVEYLKLFRLAKINKPFAIDMLYALFTIEPYKSKYDIEETVEYMLEKLSNYFLGMDATHYANLINYNVKNGHLNLLELADTHLHTLFEQYGIDSDTVETYLNLLEEHIPDEEIAYFTNITPELTVKMVILEYALHRHFMDYKKNDLFCLLGRIIAAIGKPAKKSADVQEDKKKAREKQDRVIDALHILWNECETFNREKRVATIFPFCKQNHINRSSFETLQNGFTSARWMYKLNLATPADKLTDEQKLFKKTHFDMSYVHPMCYIYQRCEDMSHLVKTDAESDQKPFVELGSKIIVRPHRVSEADTDLVKLENMKDCVRIWFISSGETKIISRKEDGEEYCSIVKDFETHLKKSSYPVNVEIAAEEAVEAQTGESNPVQDDQIEVNEDDNDGFEIV